MRFLTVANYAVVSALWLAILAFYVRYRRVARTEDPLVATLLSVLALDALKSVVENVFFGIVWTYNYGIAFPELGPFLSRPELLIAPKLLNTFVAVTVVAVVVQHWIPGELKARRQRERERSELLAALSSSLAETERNEERWQLALSATRDGIFDLDVASGRLWFSPRYAETLGYDTLAVGARDDLLSHVHEDDRAALTAFLERLVDDAAAPNEIELRQRRRDGRDRVVVLRVAAVRGDDGRATRLVGAQSDVTERRENEAALAARQRTESLGLLAGGIAHDFNNLLAIMKVNAEALRIAPSPGAQQDLETAITRATDLTSRLLAYSGRGRFVRARLDLGALARDLVRLFRSAAPEHVRVELTIDGAPAHVFGDSAQLQQVFMNLLTNAIDAIGAKPGAVSVSVRDEILREAAPGAAEGEAPIAPGRYVALTVEDTGVGMSDDVRARMFQPFFTTKSGGRGLGMAAILGILRTHKGTLRVRSAPGQGTTMTVLLPAAEEP